MPAAAIVLVAQVAFFPATDEFILAAIAAGVFFLIPNLMNPSLMGMGDVKLVVLLGAGLGWGVVRGDHGRLHQPVPGRVGHSRSWRRGGS